MAIYLADPNALLRPAANDSDEAVAPLVKVSKEGDVDPDFLRAGVIKVFADGVMEYPAHRGAFVTLF
jgi:hypothetical protein